MELPAAGAFSIGVVGGGAVVLVGEGESISVGVDVNDGDGDFVGVAFGVAGVARTAAEGEGITPGEGEGIKEGVKVADLRTVGDVAVRVVILAGGDKGRGHLRAKNKTKSNAAPPRMIPHLRLHKFGF